MKIDIVVSCVWFQRRLCWQLSSLLQQVGAPELEVDVAYVRNNGNPNTESVCSFFRSQGLKIRETVYQSMEGIQCRGDVRNHQLAKSEADWIVFADTDMAYDPLFFADLGKQLEGELREETKCIHGRRISLDKQYCKDFFNSPFHPYRYPCVVNDVAEQLSNWPIFQISRPIGAGYFHLANVKVLREKFGGVYLPPDERQDRAWGYQSDKRFRNRLGGVRVIDTKPQYHLNHERDNEEGCHLEMQR